MIRLALSVALAGAFPLAPLAAQDRPPLAVQDRAPLAVYGETVHTMAGPPLRDAVVVVVNGKITHVGPAAAAGAALPKDARVLRAKVVVPGLIDAHTVVGLSGALNQPHDQDQLERSAPMQPELRAIDAYNMRERLVEWVRGLGVTTIHTGHGPGALLSGQTMIVKTAGDTLADCVVRPLAMIAGTLGSGARGEGGKSPGTSPKAVAMLRAELLRAQEYLRKQERAAAPAKEGEKEREPPARDLRLEALGRVLRKEVPLLMTVHRAQDILAVLRVAEEFDVRVVLDGAAEAYVVVDQIKAAGCPVIVHPPMARQHRELENATRELAAILQRAGIPFAMQSGYESYVPKTRVVLWEAAIAAAYGLGADAALRAITIDAARILGVDDRIGSLEVGKDGDLALFDGDPFEYTTHCTGVVIEGKVVSETPR